MPVTKITKEKIIKKEVLIEYTLFTLSIFSPMFDYFIDFFLSRHFVEIKKTVIKLFTQIKKKMKSK